MSFELRHFGEGGTGLIAVCDVCGSLIRKAEQGNLCWVPVRFAEGEIYSYQITCAERCTDRLFTEKGHQFTQELDVALGFLFANSSFDYEATLEKMQWMHP